MAVTAAGQTRVCASNLERSRVAAEAEGTSCRLRCSQSHPEGLMQQLQLVTCLNKGLLLVICSIFL